MSPESPAPDAPHTRGERRRRRQARGRRRVSVVGVFGELLVTAGILVLLFLGWQTWWNSAVLDHQQSSAAEKQSQEWLKQAPSAPKPTATTAKGDVKPADAATPPVMKQPETKAEPFAVMYVPRFGHDWKRIVRETVDVQAVLNSFDAGVGHYPGTAMPGGIGNFAVAAHDTGYGDSFLNVSKLRIGDKIYFQTKDGWYTYTFRNMEYVQPNAINVLLPVPRVEDAKAKNRLVTLTTCNPPYHAQERIAAYGVFTSWAPPNEVPKAIAPLVKKEG